MKLLIVDNYDSFTYNLVELIRKIGFNDFEVTKCDKVEIKDVNKFSKILFTPGPGLPKDFPVMFDILKKYDSQKSILGICLGHQAIGVYYGAKLINLNNVTHGITKPTKITDEDEVIFNGIPSQINVGLYHSWFVSEQNFPSALRVTAISNDNVIMAISHNKYDVKGVQFHPESIMTEYGQKIIRNWLNM